MFGVGSVIGMLAIGAGAREESLRFIEQLGVRNVLVESRPATSQEELQQRRRDLAGTDRARRAHPDDQHRRARDCSRRGGRCIPRACCPSRRTRFPELYGVRPSYAVDPQPARGGRPVLRRAGRCRQRARSACWAKPPRSSLLGYGPAVGKFVKVNDTWLEVVGVLGEQLVASGQSSGGKMQDLNNIIYIPLNTFQYRFWDRSSFMKDDLDGVDLRLKAGRGQHRSGQGGDRDSELHASQYARISR